MPRLQLIKALSPRLHRLVQSVVVSAVISLACGCSSPAPQVIVKLEVSEFGTYSVDGHVVERTALKEVLVAKRESGKRLLVHIIPSSRAKYEAVEAAAKAAQDSGASIGVVGNEQF